MKKIYNYLIYLLLSLRYRVSLKGLAALENNKPILFLPNHQSLIDPVIVINRLYNRNGWHRWKNVRWYRQKEAI